MDFNFTKQQAEAILHNDEVGEWYDSMMKMFPQYEITCLLYTSPSPRDS